MICNSFYVVLDSDFQTFVRCLHLCSSVILFCNFLFLWHLLFWYQCDGGLMEWIRAFSFSAMFLKSLSMKPVRSFGRICLKPSGPGLLFFERLLL